MKTSELSMQNRFRRLDLHWICDRRTGGRRDAMRRCTGFLMSTVPYLPVDKPTYLDGSRNSGKYT